MKTDALVLLFKKDSFNMPYMQLKQKLNKYFYVGNITTCLIHESILDTIHDPIFDTIHDTCINFSIILHRYFSKVIC